MPMEIILVIDTSKSPYLYSWISLMGEQESKPKHQDYFLLEQLDKMSLAHPKKISYYFIDPQKNAALEYMIMQMRALFKIDHFPEIKTLKQQMNFVMKHQLVKVIAWSGLPLQDIEYLQNQKQIYQIILFGPKSTLLIQTRKIARVVEDSKDLVKALHELADKDSLKIPQNNILIVDEDTKLLNKYRLNYHCNTSFRGREKARDDFILLAKHLFPHQGQCINDFAKQFSEELVEPEKRKLVLSWAFKNSFFWELVCEITRNSTDPKRLAYVRFALKDLFESIQNDYREKKKYQTIFIIMELTEEQIHKLEKAEGRHLIFTSFVKGYTSEREANVLFKLKPNAFKFTVNSNRRKLEPSVDFGFAVGNEANPNVIFNIYNIFLVEEINISRRKVDILYGALPMSFQRRTSLDRHSLPERDLKLLRNFDYLEDLMMKIDSQATLLQLSGYYKESLEVYDKKVDFIRKTAESEESVNKCLIFKADALRRSGEFDNAEKQYQSSEFKSSKMKVVSRVHLAELYLQRGENIKFEKIMDEISPQLECLRLEEKEEYFKARNLLVILTLKKCSYQKANTMLQELIKEVVYSFPQTFEGKPLVHDIYRSMATCKSKLGKHSDALSLLKETLSWQLVCEGKTANVALTQTLIQSVSRQSGNTEQLQNSLSRLKAMASEVEASESRFESVMAADLSKSLISISTT